MLLFPKQTKFNKSFSRRKIKVDHKQPDFLSLGDFSIVAIEPGRVTSRQIEAVRRLLRRRLKKQARIWIRIFPSLPITKKPEEVRMGKGKGSVKYWVSPVRAGQILFEIKGCKHTVAKEAVDLAKVKLSVNTTFLYKHSRWIL